jgi:hypothetical protein
VLTRGKSCFAAKAFENDVIKRNIRSPGEARSLHLPSCCPCCQRRTQPRRREAQQAQGSAVLQQASLCRGDDPTPLAHALEASQMAPENPDAVGAASSLECFLAAPCSALSACSSRRKCPARC